MEEKTNRILDPFALFNQFALEQEDGGRNNRNCFS